MALTFTEATACRHLNPDRSAYCTGICSECGKCEEVHLNLADRWFYQLELCGAFTRTATVLILVADIPLD